MFYQESGQFSTRYRQDGRALRLWQQRAALWALLALAFGLLPFIGNDYWFSAILIPFLVLSLAGLGLNLLTGYAGQLSLGSAAFMAVGAFASYKLQFLLPGLPLLLSFVAGGVVAAAVGVVFGLPSLRIKGFYLLVSTLAAQFFVEWLLTKFAWFSNGNESGVITAPPLLVAGHDFGSPAGRYLLTLSVVLPLFVLAANLVRSSLGRNWMAVRDMDTAAAVIGIPILRTKLLAFAISSFILGVAGSLWAFTYLGTVEPHGLISAARFRCCSSSSWAAWAAFWAISWARPSSCCCPSCCPSCPAACSAGCCPPASWRTCKKSSLAC
ncbi:branched-chain amino acid ABC transporter permease [Aquitalea magnusonii]|uniref:branched-chain amino acid ABC transporter permease n=1 Tax=Aquitalea magnusonii TaxID=332411 RepID=UPI000A6000EB|nr:branched-chain amino acid ABC transporter permease [Aquitalea magnusonii]